MKLKNLKLLEIVGGRLTGKVLWKIINAVEDIINFDSEITETCLRITQKMRKKGKTLSKNEEISGGKTNRYCKIILNINRPKNSLKRYTKCKQCLEHYFKIHRTKKWYDCLYINSLSLHFLFYPCSAISMFQ